MVVGTLGDDVVIRRVCHSETKRRGLGFILYRSFLLDRSKLLCFGDRGCFDRSLNRLGGLWLGSLRLCRLGLGSHGLRSLWLGSLGLCSLRLGCLSLRSLGLGRLGLAGDYLMINRSTWVSSHVMRLVGIWGSRNMSYFTSSVDSIFNMSHRCVILWFLMSHMWFFNWANLRYHHLAHNWIFVIGLNG